MFLIKINIINLVLIKSNCSSLAHAHARVYAHVRIYKDRDIDFI